MHVRCIEISASRAALDRVVETYGRVFTQPPYSESQDAVAEFGERLARHVNYEGFTGYEALVGEDSVGFAYGFEYFDGGWTDFVLRSSFDEEQRNVWAEDCFEFAELAVVPEMRGRGIGRLLYEHLFEDVEYRTALLFAVEEETAASSMYEKRGWKNIVRGLEFEGNPHRFRLMGLEIRATR